MPDTLHQIPLTEIDNAVLTRDRSGLDPEAMTELQNSISTSGLRMPIEVFALAAPIPPAPDQPHRYGLLSGFRRLHAFRYLHELTGKDRYATIPAFLRPRGTTAETMAAMVEENDIREPLSPWERGRIAYLAYRQDIFPTIEEAVAKLYPVASRFKRARLCTVARLVEELDCHLDYPEALSLRQAMRIEAAIRNGFGEVIRTALEESTIESAQGQWQLLKPILAEAETPLPETPKPRPGCPRRVLHLRPGLTIRREETRDGWCLHFTGREATSWMLDDVFGDIERMYGPG